MIFILIGESLNCQKKKKTEVLNFSWIHFQYFPYRPSVLQIIQTQIMANYTSTILHKRRTTNIDVLYPNPPRPPTVPSLPTLYLRTGTHVNDLYPIRPR